MIYLSRSDAEVRQLTKNPAVTIEGALGALNSDCRLVLFEALIEADDAEYERIRDRYRKVPGAGWIEAGMDLFCRVGSIAHMPVEIRIRTAEIHGCQVGFWKPASPVAYRDLAWAWLAAHTVCPSQTDVGPMRIVPRELDYGHCQVEAMMRNLGYIQRRERTEEVGADGLTPRDRRSAPYQDGRRGRRQSETGGVGLFPPTRDCGPWDTDPRTAVLWRAGWDFEDGVFANTAANTAGSSPRR